MRLVRRFLGSCSPEASVSVPGSGLVPPRALSFLWSKRSATAWSPDGPDSGDQATARRVLPLGERSGHDARAPAAGRSGGSPGETIKSRSLSTACAFVTIASEFEPTCRHSLLDVTVEDRSAQSDQQTGDALSAARDRSPSPRAPRGTGGTHAGRLAAGSVPSAWPDDEAWRALRDRVNARTGARETPPRRRADPSAR